MADAGAIRAGKAFIELTADDGKLQKTLRSAQQKLRSFGASVDKVGRRLFTAGSAIVGSLAGLAKMFAGSGDSLDKMSHRTGIAVETLSQLSFAAEQTGQNVETFEHAIQRMQASIFDASKRGLKAPQEALTAIGLSISDIENLKPDQQFEAIAEALSKVPDPTTRAGVAMQIFGRAGKSMLPLLSSGAQGIRALREEANRLGLTVSTQTAKQAADLTDQLNRVWRQTKQLGFTIGAQLAPWLIEVGQQMQRAIPRAIKWVQAHRDAILTTAKLGVTLVAFGAGLIAVAKIITSASTVLSGLSMAIKAVNIAFVFLAANPVVAVLVAVVGSLTALALALRYATSNAAELSHAMDDLAEAGNQQRANDQQSIARLQELARAQQLTTAQMAEARAIVNDLQSRYGDLGIGVDQLNGKIIGLTAAQIQLNKAMRDAAIAEVGAQIAQEKQNVDKLNKSIETLRSGSATGHDVGVALTNVPTKGIRGAINAAVESRANDLRDALKSLEVEQAKLHALRTRREALTAGDQTALTGQPAAPAGGAVGTGAATGTDKTTEQLKAVTDAQAELARLDEQWARQHRTATENRIADIRREADERRKAIDVLIDNAPNLTAQADLLNRRRQVDQQEQTDIATVQADAAKEQADKDAEIRKRRAEAERSVALEIAQTRIDAMKDGLAKELKLIQLNRQLALRQAQIDGVDPALVNQLYDLKRQVAERAAVAESNLSRSSAGIFNAEAIQSLQTSPDNRRLIDASERTATNTDRIRRNQERTKQTFQ